MVRVDELEGWGQGVQNILDPGEGDRGSQFCLLEDGDPRIWIVLALVQAEGLLPQQRIKSSLFLKLRWLSHWGKIILCALGVV